MAIEQVEGVRPFWRDEARRTAGDEECNGSDDNQPKRRPTRVAEKPAGNPTGNSPKVHGVSVSGIEGFAAFGAARIRQAMQRVVALQAPGVGRDVGHARG